MMPPALTLLLHTLYECRKGVRHLAMLTLPPEDLTLAVARLRMEAIDHFVQPVGRDKGNLFFGRAAWVEVARRIVCRPLSQLTPEEDFILGTLLGYDREQQCRRYLVQSDRAALAVAAE